MEAYQGRQGDAGGCADELDHGAVADIPFPQRELAPRAVLIGLPGKREAESLLEALRSRLTWATLTCTGLAMLLVLSYCVLCSAGTRCLQRPLLAGSPAWESGTGM